MIDAIAILVIWSTCVAFLVWRALLTIKPFPLKRGKRKRAPLPMAIAKSAPNRWESLEGLIATATPAEHPVATLLPGPGESGQ